MDTLLSRKFESRSDLYAAIREYAISNGFDVSIKGSGKSKEGSTSFCYFKCIHGGKYKPHRQPADNVLDQGNTDEKGEGRYDCSNGVVKLKPRRTTKRLDCPWVMYTSCTQNDGHWKIRADKSKIREHSHELSTDPLLYANARKIDEDLKADVLEKSAAGIKPAQIIRTTMDINGQPTMIAKDIYNIRQKLSTHGPSKRVRELHDFLSARGYHLRYKEVDGVMKSLFITHPMAIERAQRFPEVIIIDATYKTNVNGMPLVNIIGVDNLASENGDISPRSFFIASAAVSDEKGMSYTWVLESLQSAIFMDNSIRPGLFVTDDDKALRASLKKIYPDSPHILCAWHINNNFKVHAAGCFKYGTDEYDDFFKNAVSNMIWKRTEQEFNEALSKYRDLVSKTQKSAELTAYIEL